MVPLLVVLLILFFLGVDLIYRYGIPYIKLNYFCKKPAKDAMWSPELNCWTMADGGEKRKDDNKN